MSLRLPPSPALRAMLWTGILACGALVLLIFVTRAEDVQGQLADAPTALLVPVILLVATAVHQTAACGGLVDAVTKPRSLLLISLTAFVVLAAVSWLVFRGMPASPDEQVHLFEARLFAQFKIVANYPPGVLDRIIPVGARNNLILVAPDGRAMSVYWPGWALLMTPFVWIGAPWLLGPAMASLGIYVMGRLAAMLAGAKAAAIAVLLTVTSGAFIFTGMSIFPAGGHMTLSLIYAWLLLRGGRRDTVLAGFVGGLALNLNNPIPHVVFALPWLIWLAADPERRPRLVWLAMGYAPWLVVFVGWFVATSSLRVPAPGATGGFWQDRLALLVNLPTVQILGFRFWELVRLWVWSAPGLLVLAVLGWRHQIRSSGPWLIGAAFAVTVVAYVFYPASQGLGWGARYYQSAWEALPILAALLLIGPGAEALRRIAVTAALIGLILIVPLQAVFARQTAQAYQAASDSVQALSAPGVDLYFVNFNDLIDTSFTLNDDPSLAGRVVLISYGPAADQALVDRYFPGARLVTSNSLGSGYARP
jgi:hypothetical protein